MTIERNPATGAYTIYSVIDGHLFQRRYYGYTHREAVAEFRRDAREEKSQKTKTTWKG